MEKIAIIGGGASGLVSAIFAKKNNNEVIILEKRNNCGKKILVTGNGRCNYWNQDQNLVHYNSSNMEILEEIYTENNRNECLNFFSKLGIIPYIKNGYYYPMSREASTIKNLLLGEINKLNIKVVNDFNVTKIDKKNSMFIINDKLVVDKVIVATGSYAYYNDNSSFNGYEIAKYFGHNVIKPLPALVQLLSKEKVFKDCSGVRCDVTISLYSDNKLLKEEIGEILLADYGISGICVFNLSSITSRFLDDRKNVNVVINFVPWYKQDNFFNWLIEHEKVVNDMSVDNFLMGFLNSKLVKVILSLVNIDKEKKWCDLSNFEKEKIANKLQYFNLEIIGTKDFKDAQVCSGGVCLTDINPYSMESNLIKNLYFVGEVLDVDGDCGGYNLSFAFISGMLAGKSVGNND